MSPNKTGNSPANFGDATTLNTEELFGEAKEIQLTHRGEIYRLRITAQQKLILTK